MKVALVLGGAAGVYQDAADLGAMAVDAGVEFHAVVACNQIGIRWGRITHWATLHPEHFLAWQNERLERGLSQDYTAIACRRPGPPGPQPRIDRTMKDNGGSSGLFALEAALTIAECDRAVCCGIPMTRAPHFNNEKNWAHVESYFVAWPRFARHFGPRIRSMSGRTASLLGRPDVEFLRGTTRKAGEDDANGARIDRR